MHIGQGLPVKSSIDTSGFFGSRSAGSTSTANLYEGTSACPPGQTVVERGEKPIRAAYIGAPTSEPFVYCRPIEQRAAPVQAAPVYQAPVYTTTISPVLQTEISPMISPVFQQTQASPGAVQAATPTMIAPGGMEAEGGGVAPGADGGAAMLEFMAQQAEQDRAQRAEETRLREQERRERAAADAAYRQEQLDFQREQATLQQQRQAALDAQNVEEAARLQAEYDIRVSEWEQTKATPGMYTSTMMPGREMVVAPSEVPAPITSPQPTGIPTPLLLAAGALVVVGGIMYARRGKR